MEDFDRILFNEDVNLELEFLQGDDDACSVHVRDTSNDNVGSLDYCSTWGTFSNGEEEPLTKNQIEWLKSQEVDNWLVEIGFY